MAQVAIVVVFALGTELVLSYYIRGTIPSLRAALSAALSLCVFFRAGSIFFFALAAIVAIASKYIIRLNGRHIFNPSNFAIVTLVFLLPWATTVQFIQWGDSQHVYYLIAAICFYVCYKTRTLATAVSFLAPYLILLVPSVAYLPVVFAPHHYGMLSPVLILFATFMITDPRTSPSGNVPRSMYGISIALAYFILELYGVRYSIFVALFLVLLVNAVSSFGMVYGARRVPMSAVALAPALAVWVAIFAFAYATEVSDFPQTKSPRAPSVDFVLFGIQSSELFACKGEPVLVPSEASGLESPARTEGAAWGDYNNDGFGDIFISNSDKPSRLYNNNKNGTFTDVTQEAALPSMSSTAAFFVDYDNNGTLDLFVASPMPRGGPTKQFFACAAYYFL